MARLAVLLKDPNNLIVERHGCLSVGRAAKNKKDDGCGERFEPHEDILLAGYRKTDGEQL